MNKNLVHQPIRTLISDYFVTKDGEEFLFTEKGTEISNVRKEKDENKDIFISLRKEILSIDKI